MDKRRQADIVATGGFAIFGSMLVSAASLALRERNLGAYVLVVSAVAISGIALMLLAMTYGRYFDRGECLFCGAMVPRQCLDTKPRERLICHVCSGKRLDYPRGSKDLPSKEPCLNCHRLFYPNAYMTGNGEGTEWTCNWCINGASKLIAESEADARSQGVPFTEKFTERWAAEKLTDAATADRVSLVPWLMFIVALSVVAFVAVLYIPHKL